MTERCQRPPLIAYVSLVLITCLVFNPVAAAGQTEANLHAQESTQIATVKADVQSRGTGDKAEVRVKLHNGSQIRGNIVKIEETSFTVLDKKAQTIPMSYSDVQSIRGPALPRGVKIAIGVGVGVILIAIFWIATACGSNGCGVSK